jgi:hypothetical protein
MFVMYLGMHKMWCAFIHSYIHRSYRTNADTHERSTDLLRGNLAPAYESRFARQRVRAAQRDAPESVLRVVERVVLAILIVVLSLIGRALCAVDGEGALLVPDLPSVRSALLEFNFSVRYIRAHGQHSE